jgi:hypothetical protein
MTCKTVKRPHHFKSKLIDSAVKRAPDTWGRRDGPQRRDGEIQKVSSPKTDRVICSVGEGPRGAQRSRDHPEVG